MRLKPGRVYGFVDLVGRNARVMVGDGAEYDKMGEHVFGVTGNSTSSKGERGSQRWRNFHYWHTCQSSDTQGCIA